MMHIVDTPEPTNPGDTAGEIGGEPGGEPELRVVADDSVGAVTKDRYRTDVTTLTERIAIRLAGDGAEHPVAAAITIAVRGMARLEPGDYADVLGVAPADVRALEAGTVPLGELPAALWRLVHDHGLEPVMLVDLDRQLRGD